MNIVERVAITGGVPNGELAMSASEYAEWEQQRIGIDKQQLNRAQRRALEKENRRAK